MNCNYNASFTKGGLPKFQSGGGGGETGDGKTKLSGKKVEWKDTKKCSKRKTGNLKKEQRVRVADKKAGNLYH